METSWHGGKRSIRSRPHSGFGNYSLPTHFNCLSEQGMGSLDGYIGLPALQPVLCLSRPYMGEEGPVYKYTWSVENWATWCYIPASSSCRLLVAFKPLNL